MIIIVRGGFKAVEAPERVVYHNSHWLYVTLNKFVCRVAYEFPRYYLCMIFTYASVARNISLSIYLYAIFLFLLVQSFYDDKSSYKPFSRF